MVRNPHSTTDCKASDRSHLGMANRFRALAEYHVLIKGHGVLAAITFLGVVPAAVMIARFYRPNPRMALRLHIWLQILTLLLSTIIFVLGWMAVGPPRSLTNPHHDIGLTIYVLIWVQVLWGWFSYRREKGKPLRYSTPLKIMVIASTKYREGQLMIVSSCINGLGVLPGFLPLRK